MVYRTVLQRNCSIQCPRLSGMTTQTLGVVTVAHTNQSVPRLTMLWLKGVG